MSILRVFRVVHRKHANTPYSGRGGLYAAGRWSSQGRLVSYASDSLALATLEQIARAGALPRLQEMVYVPARLDEQAVLTPAAQELPEGWDHRPAASTSRAYGDHWLEAGASVALRVPSVILPEGHNYVLNPVHPDFEEALTFHEARPLGLDSRVLDRLANRE